MAAIDLTLTLGAVEVGTSVSMLLVGVCTLQVWNYYRNFPDDPFGIKFMVGFVYIVDFIHTALLLETVHDFTIKNFGNYEALAFLPMSLQVSVFCLGIVAFVVQAFFCLRVLRVTESKILALGCFALTLTRIAFNITLAVNIVLTGDFHSLDTKFKWIITTTLCTGAASDVAIAICMCLGLMRRRSGFGPTDQLVDRLIAYIIGTGLLTSVVAVIEVICFLTMDNQVWLAFYTNLAKLFTNSLMASLNERKNLRAQMSSVNVQDTSLGGTHGAASALSQPSRLVFAKPQNDARGAVELRSIGYVPGRGKEFDDDNGSYH